MQILQTFSWPSLNWPSTSASAQYAIFQLYPALMQNQTNPVNTVSTTSVQLSYDDSQNYLYQVRPTDGTHYGPVVTHIVVNYVPCRAYVRQSIRYALADQISATTTVKFADDEINRYINEGIREVGQLFPIEKDTTISLLPPQLNDSGNLTDYRKYPLPTNCVRVKSVKYTTSEANLSLYLKYKPFRGGESSAQSYIGYPKLGILLSPLNGRFYPGHYDVYEGNLILDWGPAGDGDSVSVEYMARYDIPTDDGVLFTFPEENMELISLHAQMKCWLRIESQDTNLSRFTENKKRDDMPTEKMSTKIQRLYNERVNDRREKRVRTLRLVRR